MDLKRKHKNKRYIKQVKTIIKRKQSRCALVWLKWINSMKAAGKDIKPRCN